MVSKFAQACAHAWVKYVGAFVAKTARPNKW